MIISERWQWLVRDRSLVVWRSIFMIMSRSTAATAHPVAMAREIPRAVVSTAGTNRWA
jgi:hypothetical protein